jgi:hypothetical protein
MIVLNIAYSIYLRFTASSVLSWHKAARCVCSDGLDCFVGQESHADKWQPAN